MKKRAYLGSLSAERHLEAVDYFVGYTIRFRKEFGNIDKFSNEFGCRIISDFEFLFKFGRIAVFIN